MKKETVHLLLIEGSPPAAEMITGLLHTGKRIRFRISHCPSLGEALAWLREHTPELILADLSLPDSQGMATFRAIREVSPLVPIVVLSDTENEESALAALRMGAEEYLCMEHLDVGRSLERSLRYAMERHRIECELKQNKGRYRRILNAVTSYLYTVRLENNQTVETSHSAACEAVTGYSSEEFASRSTLWIDIVPEEDRPLVREQIQKLFAGEKVGPLEHRIIRKDGALRWISNMPVPAYDSDGVLLSYDGVVQDITERKHAEEELRTAYDLLEKRVEERTVELLVANKSLRAEMKRREKMEQELLRELVVTGALARLYAPLVSLDSSFEDYAHVVLEQAQQLTGSKHGFVATIDPQTGELFPHTFTRMMGQACRVAQGQSKTIFPPNPDGTYPSLWGAALNSKKGFYTNTPATHPAAKGLPPGHVPLGNFLTVPVLLGEELVGQIALAGKPKHYNARDLQAIQRLADYYAMAIQRQRNETKLHQALQAAEQASRAKSEFLANMSHEIRTPMNAIMGMINLAIKQPLPPKAMEYLRIAKLSNNALLGIINDILDFSKIESGKLSIESIEFSVQDILINLLEMFRESGRDKGLDLNIDVANDVPDLVIGDPLRVGQVLMNLVGNAIKFTNQGEITVSIHCLERSEESVRLEFQVLDSGIGIPTEKIASIFAAFAQADGSTTRKYGGTGLGLTICKKLVHLMGGEIRVESTPGVGSAFSFALPLRLPAARQVSAPEILDFSGKRILVVDDEEYLVRLLHAILESHGFTVVSATRPSEALRILQEETIPTTRFDLILLDLMLPEQDGIITARAIRGDTRLRDIPIIILTGMGSDLEEQRAKQAGVNGFLRKPVSRTLLLSCINDILGESMKEPAACTRVDEKEATTILRGKKILLVEDNLFNQMVAQEVLANVGIIVTVANNGKEALAMLDDDVAAVLMDIQMPEMDGYEATRAIRQQPRFAKLPIIAMTAHAMSGDREICLAAGMDNYVAKPFEPEEVFAMLTRYVGGEATEKREPGPEVEKCRAQDDLVAAIHVHLEKVYGFDPEKRTLMLEGAQKTLLEQFVQGAKALAGNDLEGLSRVGHSIKGSLGALGLKELAGLAERIEKQQTRSADNKGEVLLAQFAELRKGLSSWLG
ncbi:MAG: response regulator [Desulfobulbaceae bacterium]|nr:response regulator [Desulfobulbaceae bacterium]HIJ89529.1 response regulator [Deltaproteobacteria bacterium]